MSTPEVAVIPWDNSSVDTILEKHIVHVKLGTSRGADELFRECIFDLLGSNYDWFVTYIFSIVGMEVEGQEVSLGLVLFKGDIPINLSQRFKDAKLGRWVYAQKTDGLHLGMQGFADFRKIVRRLRSDLIGWVPGRFLEPVLILTGSKNATPFIQDVKILSAKMATLTAHELYVDLTKDERDCFAIWIKSAGTIRIYRWGKLFGQIMRLRDAGGWTTRHMDRMVQIVQYSARIAGIQLEESTCRALIVEPSVSISESRRGATVVVMKPDAFRTLESKWNVRGASVACKAKHAPIIEETQESATEPEYENYLAQDGAVVISPDGKLLGMGTYFQGGPGGRRDTAAWLPTVVDKCITIVVSQDGPIYLHWASEKEGKKRGEGVRLDFIPTGKSDPIQLDPEKEEEDVGVAIPDLT